MRILVTGADGQIGAEIIRQSKDVGLEAVGTSRKQLDITNIESVEKYINFLKPICVVNTAAYTKVDEAEEKVELAYAVNQIGVRNLAIVCQKLHILLVHISTDYVFDGLKKSPYTESDRTNPICVYGESKRAGEKEIEELLEKYLIIRTSWVFSGNGKNFFDSILQKAKNREKIRVVNDQVGTPTSARSVANYIVEVLNRYFKSDVESGIYHFAGRPSVSWFEFAEAIIFEASALGLIEPTEVSPLSSKDYKTLASRPKNSRLESNKNLISCESLYQDWQLELRFLLNQYLDVSNT
ncbi:dTDP-4-dehydrorhamnose reductase [Aurantivibrio infirmus]